MPQVAFHTIGLLQMPLGSPQLKDYEAITPTLFERMREAPGFIRLVDWEGVLRPKFAQAEGCFPVSTLSVWSDLESVFTFSYRGIHGDAMRRRREWFHKPEQPTHVAWWVANDHVPSWAEAVERHEHLHDNGPTPFAFSFHSAFNAAGSPMQVRKVVRETRAPEDQP